MPARFTDRWFLILGSALILAIAGGALLLVRSSLTPRKASPETKAVPAEPAPSDTELSFTGPVQALNAITIGAPVDGTVEVLEVEEGAEVTEGQVIARIKNQGLESSRQAAAEDLERIQTRVNNLESSLIQARLEASRSTADADRARNEAARTERIATREQALFREGATARLKYEKAQKDFITAATESKALAEIARQATDRIAEISRDLDIAKKQVQDKIEQVENAQADLETGVVHSPVDGVLIKASVKPGDEVDMSNKDLFQVAIDTAALMIVIEPSPAVQEKLKDGQEALVQILEHSGDALTGELKRSDTGSWRVEFAATDPNIKPGLNATVKIRIP